MHTFWYPEVVRFSSSSVREILYINGLDLRPSTEVILYARCFCTIGYILKTVRLLIDEHKLTIFDFRKGSHLR